MSGPRVIVLDDGAPSEAGFGAPAGSRGEAADRAFSDAAREGGSRRVLVVCGGSAVRSEVVPGPRGVPRSRALRSAELSISQSAGLEGELEVASAVLWTDPPGSGEARRHVVGLGMSASELESIAQAGARAGFRVDGVVSRDAMLIGEAVRSLGARGGVVTVLLWVDEAGSVLAISQGAMLALVRHVGIGIRTLVEMVSRVTLGDGVVGVERARQWLGACGVPSPESVMPGEGGVSGSAILPAMESALQRLAMEARQSLRFAVSESARGGARLVVAGPGGGVRGLGEALSARTGMAVEAGRPARAGARALSRLARGAAARGLVLRPGAWREARERGRWRAGLAVGVAVAMTLAGIEWLGATRRAQAALGRLSALESRGLNAGDAGAAEALRREVALDARVVERGRAWMSGARSYSAALAALGQATHEGITLTSIELAVRARRAR